MRQLTKELKDIDVLFFEMPKDAADYYLDEDFGDLVYNKGYIHVELWRPHKIKDYEIIGEDPLTEEQAARVVPGRRRENGKIVPGIPNEWDSYIESEGFSSNGNICFRNTAIESVASLIKSLGILTENPFKVPIYPRYQLNSINLDIEIMNNYKEELKRWQEAQANVWEKVLIVIRKKK